MSLAPAIVGRVDSPPAAPCCIECRQPFKGGNLGDEGVNVYTKDGMREVAITGMCETCFDALFDDPEQDDEPYCICGNSPTEDEDASNTCASCGKAFT